MTRNLVILGCAALLALGLSFGTFAGSVPDGDGDGVPDQFDNCDTLPNGPLAQTDNCDGQEDGDLDGYGNPCDFDFSQDGFTSLPDLASMLDNVSAAATDPNFHVTCSGFAALPDLARALDNTALVTSPGSSGLACANLAGTPCTAE